MKIKINETKESFKGERRKPLPQRVKAKEEGSWRAALRQLPVLWWPNERATGNQGQEELMANNGLGCLGCPSLADQHTVNTRL